MTKLSALHISNGGQLIRSAFFTGKLAKHFSSSEYREFFRIRLYVKFSCTRPRTVHSVFISFSMKRSDTLKLYHQRHEDGWWFESINSHCRTSVSMFSSKKLSCFRWSTWNHIWDSVYWRWPTSSSFADYPVIIGEPHLSIYCIPWNPDRRH